jgi:hypothetical protein
VHHWIKRQPSDVLWWSGSKLVLSRLLGWWIEDYSLRPFEVRLLTIWINVFFHSWTRLLLNRSPFVHFNSRRRNTLKFCMRCRHSCIFANDIWRLIIDILNSIDGILIAGSTILSNMNGSMTSLLLKKNEITIGMSRDYRRLLMLQFQMPWVQNKILLWLFLG